MSHLVNYSINKWNALRFLVIRIISYEIRKRYRLTCNIYARNGRPFTQAHLTLPWIRTVYMEGLDIYFRHMPKNTSIDKSCVLIRSKLGCKATLEASIASWIYHNNEPDWRSTMDDDTYNLEEILLRRSDLIIFSGRAAAFNGKQLN